MATAVATKKSAVVDDQFTAAKGSMHYRKGTRPGWLEVEVRDASGKVLGKLIARRVEKFYSEDVAKKEEL